MITPIGTAAPVLRAEAFVRGEQRRTLDLADFRGTWLVVAFGVRHADVMELARLEEAFAADGPSSSPPRPTIGTRSRSATEPSRT